MAWSLGLLELGAVGAGPDCLVPSGLEGPAAFGMLAGEDARLLVAEGAGAGGRFQDGGEGRCSILELGSRSSDPGSLGEEPPQGILFVHGVLAVFEESPLPVRGRAVLVLLVGGLGVDGVAGFLPRWSFLCSSVWHINYSAHQDDCKVTPPIGFCSS